MAGSIEICNRSGFKIKRGFVLSLEEIWLFYILWIYILNIQYQLHISLQCQKQVISFLFLLLIMNLDKFIFCLL